jgi:predicted DNA-binding transcriptional regulator YafY
MKTTFTYAVEQRLRLVDFLLAQYGHVKRAALMDYFGIGEATATRDFTAYHEIALGNMALNSSDKTYYRTNSFVRIWK